MSFTRPEHPLRVALVAVAVLAGVNIAILGARSQVNGPAAVQRPGAIVQLEPEEGQLTLPQGRVGAQLRTQFTAQLLIDNHLIPQDQTTGDPGLGEYYFEPGPGKEFGELPKGAHNAVVQWWPRAIATPEAAKAQGKLASYSWAFNVG
ncbi:MAG TPA: hypothetical protein VEZ15_17130 [Acidimicrobiia bacterium]|nr:hypothetical protein [Acidimicrobiia bacterium]